MSSPQMALANEFYKAFQKRDAESMVRCYSEAVEFSDPVFPSLKGQDAGDMWRMLCKNGKDLRVEYTILGEEQERVRVRWDAYYTFSKSGRSVHNSIVATMTIQSGKIVRHIDDFSFWRWSKQAIGPAGLVLGWSPILKAATRRSAKAALIAFQEKRGK